MAWLILVQLGLLALSLAASYYLAPKPANEKAKRIGLGDLNFPRADEGDAMPLAYGRVRINSPIVVSIPAAAVRTLDLEFDGDYRATKYYIAMKMVLALGNTETGATTGGATFISMLVGDKVLPIVPFDLGATVEPVTAGSEVYYLQNSDIFGGPLHGGGMAGVLVFYGGRWDQERRAFDIWSTEIAAEVPNYRGQVVVSLTGTTEDANNNNPFLKAGWALGETPNIPNYSFVIENPITISGYDETTGSIGEGDANPAAVIYDLLTNEWGRLGNATSTVDLASFIEVATTLRDEEHGISFVIQNPNDAKDVIDQILRQIDGVLYEDPETRQYTLRLIREDYVVADLPILTVSNVLGEPVKPSSLWQETVNEVRVIWTDPEKGYKDAVAVAQDMANVAAQGGRRRSREFRFPGVSNAKLAYHLASRELNFLARPLEKLELEVNRSQHGLKPGDAFVFTWPDWDSYSNVFRVMDLDHGTLEDGSIRITAVQDRFSFPANVFDPPETIGPTTHDPRPIIDRTITEAPRWIQQRAYNAGLIPSVDAQHGYYLAAPEGDDSRYRVDADINGAGSIADTPGRPFPGTFTVSTAYDSRTKAGYDSATGLVITDVVGWTPTAATAAEVAQGANLIMVGGELLTFLTVTGTGPYTLGNVWPAVADTVPALHAVGTVGYKLPGTEAVGALGSGVFPHGTTIETLTAAAYGSNWTPDEVNPADTIVARSRGLLPYPGAKLLVNASAAPAALGDDEGVTIDWRDRLRTTATLTRQDASDETMEVGVTFDAVGYKDAHPLAGGTQVALRVGLSSHTEKVALGGAGHGALEVGIDARKVVSLPDGSTPTLGGWQVPTLPITAHHYRNLLLNPRFADGTGAGWTWTTGTPAVGTTSALGGAGSYITGNAGTPLLDGYQIRDVAGYDPVGLKAILSFASVKNPAGGGTDTVTVVLSGLDSGGNPISSSVYGPTATATWNWQTLELTLDADTSQIGVYITLTGGGATVASAVTECHLYVGQISDQQLTDPSFESTAPTFANWTATVGTWQRLTAAQLYGSPTYARPNDGASAQLRQDVALATGYEGGVAVLRVGRGNDAADDTGSVTLAALDAGGSVIATTSTATEAITSGTWARRLLALELPVLTATVRVQLDATRVTGTPLNSLFDDLDLRLHKHLDPDESIVATFDTPMSQRLPATVMQWYRDFPAVVAPNHALFTGAIVGALGTESMLEAVGVARVLATAVVDMEQPSAVKTTTAYEMPSRTAGSTVRVAPVGTSFANFSNAQDWAGLFFFKVREPGAWNGAADLCGRLVGGVGWYLWITLGGCPALTVVGASSSITLTGLEVVIHGDLSGVGVSFDEGDDTVTLIDGVGNYTTSTAAIGQFSSSDVGRFAFWGSGSGLPPFAGQILRGYLWRGDRPTAAELATTLTYLDVPDELALVTSW